MNENGEQFFPPMVIGLGNPEEKYQDNRHNIGFQVVEALARKRGLSFTAEDPRYLTTKQTRDTTGLILLKPMTYMNLSGEAVSSWLDRHDLEPDPSRILVVCDDLALPLGTVRLRGKGSSGGQNGLASVILHLGTEGFPRLRLGIDGTEGEIQPEQWPDYVLADFEPAETKVVAELVDRAVLAVECWLDKGLEQAASRFNGMPDPDTI